MQGQIDNLISKETIQSFVDLKANVDLNVSSLERLIARAVELNKSIGGNLGFKQFGDQIKSLELNEKALSDQSATFVTSQQKLTAAIEGYARSLSTNSEAQKAIAQTVRESIDNSSKEARARKVNADAMLAEARAAAILAKAKKDIPQNAEVPFTTNVNANGEVQGPAEATANKLTVQQTQALNDQLDAQRELNTEVNKSTAGQQQDNQEKAKASSINEQLIKTEQRLDEAKDEGNVHIQENKILTREATELAKRQALQNLGLLSSYDKLVLEYKQAAIAAKDLAVAHGIESKEAKEAAASALTLDKRIKAIDSSVGQSQKNVGNYGSAFTKVFGQIRLLAQILPGIGIAGIFGLLFEGIGKAISSLDLFGNKASRVNDSIAESFRSGGDAALKQAADIQTLYSITQDANAAIGDRVKATKEVVELIKENNKLTGESNQLLVANNGVLAAQPELIDKISAALIRQAKTRAVVNSIEKAYGELIAAQTGSLTDNFQQLSLLDQILSGLKLGAPGGGQAADALATTLTKPAETALEKLKNLQEYLEKGLKDGSLTLNGVFKSKGTADDAGFAQLKAQGIEELKLRADLQKRLSEIDSLELQTRLTARKEAANAEDLISSREYQVAIRNAQAKFAASKGTLKDQQERDAALAQAQDKAAGTSLTIETKYQEDLIEIRQSYIARQKDIDKRANDDSLAAFAEAQNQRLLAIQRQAAAQQTNLAGGKDIEIESLNRRYDAQYKAAGDNQKKITDLDRKYAIERGNIEFTYARDALKDQIATAEKLIKFNKDNGKDTLSDEEKLSKAKQDLSDLELQHALANNEKRRKSEKEVLNDLQSTLEKIQDIGNRVFSVIGGIIDGQVTAQKNALQAQSDQLDKNTAKEIAAVEASGDSAQKKADRIAIINAKAQSQKDLIDIKQRQADEKKARFDKAQAVFGIIINTALAVVKALPNVALAAIIGALGAAELAVAIASPIPKYRTGTGDHPGGLALVGDGGKQELVIEPTGKMYATRAVPEVMNLPKHSIVLPDLQKVLENGIMAPWRGGSSNKDESKELLTGIKRELSLLRKSSGQKGTYEKVGHRGFTSLVRFGNNWNKYIDESINF